MALPELPRNGSIRTSEGRVAAPHLESRLIRQDARIGQGLKSGSLSGEELEQVRTQRGEFYGSLTEAKGDDGRVDREERKALHQEMNQMSQALYGFKHN